MEVSKGWDPVMIGTVFRPPVEGPPASGRVGPPCVTAVDYSVGQIKTDGVRTPSGLEPTPPSVTPTPEKGKDPVEPRGLRPGRGRSPGRSVTEVRGNGLTRSAPSLGSVRSDTEI